MPNNLKVGKGTFTFTYSACRDNLPLDALWMSGAATQLKPIFTPPFLGKAYFLKVLIDTFQLYTGRVTHFNIRQRHFSNLFSNYWFHKGQSWMPPYVAAGFNQGFWNCSPLMNTSKRITVRRIIHNFFPKDLSVWKMYHLDFARC